MKKLLSKVYTRNLNRILDKLVRLRFPIILSKTICLLNNIFPNLFF
jgi:hypothetical protein